MHYSYTQLYNAEKYVILHWQMINFFLFFGNISRFSRFNVLCFSPVFYVYVVHVFTWT